MEGASCLSRVGTEGRSEGGDGEGDRTVRMLKCANFGDFVSDIPARRRDGDCTGGVNVDAEVSMIELRILAESMGEEADSGVRLLTMGVLGHLSVMGRQGGGEGVRSSSMRCRFEGGSGKISRSAVVGGVSSAPALEWRKGGEEESEPSILSGVLISPHSLCVSASESRSKSTSRSSSWSKRTSIESSKRSESRSLGLFMKRRGIKERGGRDGID